MKMLIDETGNKYGMVTVLSKANRPEGRVGSFWNVRCECGKEWVVERTKLSCGQKSCFECNILIRNKAKTEKNIGKKFGYLTIVQPLDEYAGEAQPKRLYLCRCVCGNDVKCTLTSLNAYKESCGCMDYLKPSNNYKPQYMSLIGKRFGCFIVVDKGREWFRSVLCKCDCGYVMSIKMSALLKNAIPECRACKKERERRSFEKEFVGSRFGSLTALEPLPKEKFGWRWNCRCDCGNELVVLENNLKKGNSTRCPDCKAKIVGEQQIKDLSGQKFGMLTVLSRAEKNGSGNYCWACKCDCGEETIVCSSNLLTGHTLSCGCAISTGEVLLSKALRKNKIKFVKQKKFDGCVDKGVLRFDFYLPDYGWCIECNGHQHYRPVEWFGGEEQFDTQKRRDKIKSDFCKSNFIPLIRIHYSDYKEMDRVADSIAACFKRLPSTHNNINVR